MLVIVAGSRKIAGEAKPENFSRPAVQRAIAFVLDCVVESGYEISGIISGCAPGVDTAALMKPWACPVIKVPADWKAHGKSAGYRRNVKMGAMGEALVAVWNGVSTGTGNMISIMKSLDKPYRKFTAVGDE